MLNAYYKLWVDAILFEKNKRNREINWKAYTLIPISLLMGINLFTILYWMNELTHHRLPVILIISAFNVKLINIFISIITMYFIPFLLLNYLAVFYGQRYNELIKIYKNNNGKLYRSYSLISIGVMAIPFILKWLF